MDYTQRLDAANTRYSEALADVARISLVQTATLTVGAFPGAARLEVETTDQDDSGHLVTNGDSILDTNGDQIHWPDDADTWEGEVWGPLSNLDDRNKHVWKPYFVGHDTRSGLTGYLDLTAIIADTDKLLHRKRSPHDGGTDSHLIVVTDRADDVTWIVANPDADDDRGRFTADAAVAAAAILESSGQFTDVVIAEVFLPGPELPDISTHHA